MRIGLLPRAVSSPSLDSTIAMEDRHPCLTSQTVDVAEGMRAFLEKRTPVYKDR